MSDTESASLVDTTSRPVEKHGMPGTGRKKPPPPDWGKFGLSQEPVKSSYRDNTADVEDGYQHADAGNKNELFQEDMVGVGPCEFSVKGLEKGFP